MGGGGGSPVVVRPVAPVVPVVVVLVRAFSGGDVVAVTTGAAVHVSVRAAVVVVLVAVRFVLVVAVSLPGLVAVAWIRVFTVPRPVPPLCNEAGRNYPIERSLRPSSVLLRPRLPSPPKWRLEAAL